MCDAELMRDPYTGYARLREQAPLVRGLMPGVDPAWIVTRYEDVQRVLSDPRFVNDRANVPGIRVPNMREQVLRAHEIPGEYWKYRLLRMDAFDGAEHTRLRKLVSQAFTVRRITELRPRVEEIADGLLDRLPGIAEDGVVDLIPHFANRLPSAVLCELVGIPDHDRPRWEEWYAAIPPTAAPEAKAAAWRALVPYARSLIERRRAEPGDDLVSAMIAAQDEDGERLSDTEMIAMMVMLGLTGPHTNATFIGNGVLALLTHPEQLALLRRRPELMPRAVEELLRWCGPTQVVPRTRFATEDLEIGGMPVREGEAVWVVLAGANHDPARFDDPERLDITREPASPRESHVAFGGGAHHCLAAAQARQDAEVAFEALLRRYPDITLAADPSLLGRDPMPFQWRLTTLPVRL
ncbi:MAG: cytochrome P450 [Streptosporangiales bacterium]|nr:cytochrome P450 [Streptosporangiales bacterium]